MGRLGILIGAFVSALAISVSLVTGGGIGAPSSAVTGSGLEPGVSAPSEAAPEPGAVHPVALGTITRTTTPAEPTAPAAAETSTTGEEPAAPVADAPQEASADLPAAPELTASTSGTTSPWDAAQKQIAPSELSPAYLSTDPETIARVAAIKAAGKACPALGGYTTSGAPSKRSAQGVAGTTSADLIAFADQYNLIRYQNCLPPVSRFVYDSCMEARLFWMAESPSPDPLDAWGHIGSTRIDGVPSVGCDGNLAGGSGNTGATVAKKWWDSLSHRASLYRPPNSTAGVCIALAITHGGIDEPTSFTRAAASWRSC